MTRTKENYPPNTLATLHAIRSCHDALTHGYAVRDHEATADDGVTPPMDTLLAELPQGPITTARLEPGAPTHASHVAFTMGERNARLIEAEGFLVIRVLTLFAGGHIDKNSTKEAERKDYLEVGSDLGLTIMRILANAQAGEMVKLRGEHHDLRASNLQITRSSPRSQRGRREAQAEALKGYDKALAKDRGLAADLSRWDYQTLIGNCFRFYDIKHAHHFLRVIGGPDAA